MSNSTGKAIVGFIFGAAVGVAAGILFAPTSGAETRKKLEKKSKEYSDELAKTMGKKIDDLKYYVNDIAKDTKEKIKQANP